MEHVDSPNHGAVKRSVGTWTATGLVVANMIGAGVFTTSGIMAANLPDSGWVLLCWVFGGLIALSGALCYAELATRMPHQGGEYVYLKTLFHPALGFLTGWMSFVVGFSVPTAASALGFSSYFFAGLATAGSHPAWFNTLCEKGLAILIILIFTFTHYRGIALGSRVQNALTLLKIGLVVGLAVAGLVFGAGSFGNIGFSSASTEGMAVGTSMMLVGFAYSGWNASAYIAGELKNPRRALPVSLTLGTVAVVLIYVAVNLFLFHAVTFDELKGVITVAEMASTRAFGSWIGRYFSVLVSLALLSSLSAFVMIGPRVYFAMARDRLFFSFAGRIHSRFGVPSLSIAIQGGLAIVMVAVGSFQQLLVYLGFSLSLFPFLAVLGVFFARRRRIGEPWAVRTWGYPWVPLFYLFSTFALMVITFVQSPLESGVALATVTLGIPAYFLWIRPKEKVSSSV